MPSPKFPKTLFVREEKDGTDLYYVSYAERREAIEEDGPTVVAVYSLTGTTTLRKVVQEG